METMICSRNCSKRSDSEVILRRKMKLPTLVSKVVVCIALFLLAPSLMFANRVAVDCVGVAPGTFVSITAALASLSHAGPNDIFVSCNTTDNVLIVNFSQLSILATPGTATVTATNPNQRVLNITDSTGIIIDGINFTGGFGITVNNSGDVQLGEGTIQNSARQGIITLSSTVDIFGSPTTTFTIKNNARSGLVSTGGDVNLSGGVTITSNRKVGLIMMTAHLTLNGGNRTPANP